MWFNKPMQSSTVEPVVNDHPIDHKNVGSQGMWSFGESFHYTEIQNVFAGILCSFTTGAISWMYFFYKQVYHSMLYLPFPACLLESD